MINLANCNQIHCIGIGGIGVSAIAEILLSRGKTVTGSDMKESAMTDRLIEQGAIVYLGHREKNVEGADLVIYTNAVSTDNPELKRAKELGIPAVTRAEALGALMTEYSYSIAISGTHGKTTTTSMVSLILKRAAFDPTILVGGTLSELGGNVAVGRGEYFVTEACEYMDSFLSLSPKIEIILNIDSDHLDYFKDINHITRSFDKFASYVPQDGMIVAYDANPFVHSVIKGKPGVVTFGLSDNCDYFAENIEWTDEGRPVFDVCTGGEGKAKKRLGRVQLAVPGEHNILNALAAFACCHRLDAPVDVIIETLHDFTGTDRRFDITGTTEAGVQVIDDYAHHPTEIKATLAAASKIPHNLLWCCFQPHTYTRTLALFDQFADAFADADVLILAEIYAAREKNIYKISSEKLAEEIRSKHPSKAVVFIPTFEEIADYVYEHAKKGDVVLTMGAGDIYKVGELILNKDFEEIKK